MVLKIFRTFFLLLNLSFITLNAHALNEFESPLSLYSENEFISPNEPRLVFEQTLLIWEKLLNEEYDEPFATSPNERFAGELLTAGESVYLKVTDQISDRTYYHFFDGKENPELLELKRDLYVAEIDPHEMAYRDLLKKVKKLESFDLTPKKELWDDMSQKTLEEVVSLYKDVKIKWAELEIKANLNGEDFMAEYVNRNKVYVHTEGIGKGELNSINGHYFIRIVHEQTELSFGIGSKGEIDFKTPHFQQYLSRQHILAGHHRADKQTGRDFIFIQVDDIKEDLHPEIYDPKRFSEFERPECFKDGVIKRTFCASFWKKYKQAIIKKVSMSDFKFGAICGIVQGAITFCMANAINTIVPGSSINTVAPSLFTAAWGTAFGVITPTFKNWTRASRSTFWQTIKHMSNGIAFQYGITIFLNPDGLAALSIFTLAGIINHLKIYAASYLSNRAKPNWYKFVTAREKAGLNRGDFTFKSFRSKVQQSNVEHQLAYTPAFVFRFLERSNLGLPATWPAGTALLMSSIPLSEFLVLNYLKKLAIEEKNPDVIKMAQEAQASWDIKKLFFKDGEVRSLILKKFFYKLIWQRKSQMKVHAKLVNLHPDLFHNKDFVGKKDKIKVNPHEIRNFEIPQISPEENHTCLKIMNEYFIFKAPTKKAKLVKNQDFENYIP